MTSGEKERCRARAAVFKALADPVRVFVIEKIREKPCCVSELADLAGRSEATISKHLAVLKDAGLVAGHLERLSL